jgi:hypothetical protein
MLPRRLAHVLNRLDRLDKRTPDQQELYAELLDVARRLHPLRSGHAGLSVSTARSVRVKLPTDTEILKNLVKHYSIIDDTSLMGKTSTRAGFIDDPSLISKRSNGRRKG